MKASVIIRTRDNETYLCELVKNLALQTVQASEIIVVDNFSTDEKRRILANELSKTVQASGINGKVRLITFSDDDFSHAYSTNLGVSAARNEYVCLTNAHSLPTSPRWLQDGMRHFGDPKVAGVSGFFVPHREGRIAKKLDVLMYYFSQKMILRQDWCSTINCIIRKSLWRLYPFDEDLPKFIPETRKYGLEDYDWSKEMLARGYRIVVDPLFSVFHSHERGFREFARNTKSYFVYWRIQQKINLFRRPRESFSRVFRQENSGRIREDSSRLYLLQGQN